LTGEYQPESILPGEMELGEQFGVSRTAVREAVKTLAAKGMLLTTPAHRHAGDATQQLELSR
jgi:DNA-binding FadR family transcriptional regulator